MSKLTWREEFWLSIKSFDTEEKLDLYFYRPVGFLIAKIGLHTGLTPTALTVIGLTLGIFSGKFFYHNDSTSSLMIGAALFILAGLFDSADGQLARMGGKSTKIGRILDGICDNVVFISAYAGLTMTCMPQYGWTIWIFAVLGGGAHSWQSSALDYFNREYLFFGYGKVDGDYWNPTEQDLNNSRKESSTFLEKLMFRVHLSWMLQQRKISPRSDALRENWRKILASGESKVFQEAYRNHNRLILRFWRLMGPNFHTICILLFAFLKRFDIYLIYVDFIVLTLCLLVLRSFQKSQDRKLIAAMDSRAF